MATVKKAAPKAAPKKAAPKKAVVKTTPAAPVESKVSAFDTWWEEVGRKLQIQGHGIKVIVQAALDASVSETTFVEYVNANPGAHRGSSIEAIAKVAYEA